MHLRCIRQRPFSEHVWLQRWRGQWYGCALLLLMVFSSDLHVVRASEATLQVDVDMGAVLAIEGKEDTLWIGTALGLYRWTDAPRSIPEVALKVKNVRTLLREGKALWIGTDEGLFLWDDPRQGGNPRLISSSQTSVRKLYLFGNKLLIIATGGLFVWQDGSPGELRHLEAAGPDINWVCQDGNANIWIASDQGLFSWDGVGDAVPVPLGESLKVTSLHSEGVVLLIGTSKGLLRWIDAPTGNRDWVFRNTEVYSLYKDTATLLISTKGNGLRGLDDVRTGQWKPIAEDIGTSSRYYRIGSVLWMGAGPTAEAGLYRWESTTEELPQHMAGINIGFVHCFYKRGDTLWIGADKGLFKLDGLTAKWDAQVKIISKKPSVIYSDYSLPIRWRIDNYGWRTTPEQVYCRVILTNDATGKEEPVEDGEGYGRHSATLPALSSGSYTLYVQATDLNGKTSLSEPFELQVYSTRKDVIWWVVKIYGLVNIIVTILLIFLSRWYQGAFDIFTSPWMKWGSLYFGFSLCYTRFVRLWVFERYYRELKDTFSEDRPYLTAEIQRPDGTIIEPDKLLSELQKHPHILIQGESGAGKTALLKRLLKIYCQSSSLRRAFRLYGFIPIFVRARDFADPTVTGNDSTIANLARLALGARDMLFHDKGLFERIIRRKDFLIILDGLNEADIDKPATGFVATSPKVRFLATSQTPLSSVDIEIYRLPTMTPGFARELLATFIKEQADEVYKATTDEFWQDIRSGYDVRLIQNAVEKKLPLPTTRLELFDATIKYAGKGCSLNTIYAHAWKLWKEERRRFGKDETLTESLIIPLQEANVVVARGSMFEFRHDLMRSYLAACWLVREVDSIEGIKGQLSDERVWNLGMSEQNLMFPFLTELLETQDDLKQIMQFAAEKPIIRVRLFTACKDTAAMKNWSFTLSINETSPDLQTAT